MQGWRSWIIATLLWFAAPAPSAADTSTAATAHTPPSSAVDNLLRNSHFDQGTDF
jgi:hypothetical protein